MKKLTKEELLNSTLKELGIFIISDELIDQFYLHDNVDNIDRPLSFGPFGFCVKHLGVELIPETSSCESSLLTCVNDNLVNKFSTKYGHDWLYCKITDPRWADMGVE